MACCLMAPSHYPNQWWLIIKGVLWHSHENLIHSITTTSPKGWVKHHDELKNRSLLCMLDETEFSLRRRWHRIKRASRWPTNLSLGYWRISMRQHPCFLPTVYELIWSIFCKLSLFSNSNCNNAIMPQIWTCHSSTAAVACANLWHDEILILHVRSTHSFHT